MELFKGVKETNSSIVSREAKHFICTAHEALSYHRLLPISPPFLANQIRALWKVRRIKNISLNLSIFRQPPQFGNV